MCNGLSQTIYVPLEYASDFTSDARMYSADELVILQFVAS